MKRKQSHGTSWRIAATIAVCVGTLVCEAALGQPSVYEGIWSAVNAAAQQAMPFAETSLVPYYEVDVPDPATLRARLEAHEDFGLRDLVVGDWGEAGVQISQDSESLSLQGGEMEELAFFASGYISLVNVARVYSGTCTYGSEDAVFRALTLVSRVAATDSHQQFRPYQVMSFFSQGSTPQGDLTEKTLNAIAVVLSRWIDGVPEIGPGGKVVFLFSGDGDIVGVHRNLRAITQSPTGWRPIRNATQFADSVVNALRLEFGSEPPFSASDFKIAKCEVGFFSDAKRHAQRFIQPAYALLYELDYGGVSYGSEFILPAFVDPVEQIEPAAQELPASLGAKPGACCLPNGECKQETEAACQTDKGSFCGAGTSCGEGCGMCPTIVQPPILTLIFVPRAGAYYTLTAKCSGKCLDVTGSNASNGTNVQQWDSNGTGAQLWRFEHVSGRPSNCYRIINLATGKCLDLDTATHGEGKENGANVQTWENVGGTNQMWFVDARADGYLTIRSVYADMCLDVTNSSTDTGANVQAWTCNGTDAQAWAWAEKQ
jgi:hypothetical protein